LLGYCNAAIFAGNIGQVLFDLAIAGHNLALAIDRLTTAAAGYTTSQTRARALCLTKLASLIMATGDPIQAATIGHTAWTPPALSVPAASPTTCANWPVRLPSTSTSTRLPIYGTGSPPWWVPTACKGAPSTLDHAPDVLCRRFENKRWHTPPDMNVRTGVTIVSAVSLGLIVAGCGGAAQRAEPSLSPSATPEAAELSAPGVSWLKVDPEQGVVGAAVSLDVACLDNLGIVHSPVLDIGALNGDPEGHQPWHQFATATVRPDAVPGRHQIVATCGTEELSTAFTVVPSR
jgi:hypothetical protein